MKNLARIVVLVSCIGLLTSCSELVKKTIKDNPDIVFEAIKKDPAGFMEVVRNAAMEDQKVEAEQAQKQEEESREEERREERGQRNRAKHECSFQARF